MKIELSSHAQDRLGSRKISEEHVFKTLANPDETFGSYRSRKLSRKKFNDKILEVVSIKEKSKIIIITAYYLE